MSDSKATSSTGGLFAAAAALSFIFVGACDKAEQPHSIVADDPVPTGTVFVHLFEWKWPDVANEFEEFLGPAGYAAVQVSPPNEHVPGPAWWTRYQPVSYRLQSRGGTREQFADMVRRCHDAGVDIYADAIINHMSYVGTGNGVGGSEFAEYQYPVPYSFGDFHHCDRHGDDAIRNYQDLWEVQNCELVKLADLDTGKPDVQQKIANYLNDLLGLGVTGFRIDAAKHMTVDDIGGILRRLNAKAHVYQEVIDRGGEPIHARGYLKNGLVTEFKYSLALLDAFAAGKLDSLSDLASRPGFLPAEGAIVFVDNHDIQRGHAGAGEVLTYKSGKLYELANVFMLAWPYGQPMVMSSYRFEDGDQGPPDSQPIDSDTKACDRAWVCEHRFPSIAGMIGFHNATAGVAVSDWQALDTTAIAFGRGDKGFVIINIGAEPISPTVHTGMRSGEYCNAAAGCNGTRLEVSADGTLSATLPPMSATAIHAGTRVNDQ
jgi:alpha-amylase